MRAIKPINNNGGILFRFSVQGKRFAFTPIPGGKFDDPDDLKAAMAIAAQIEGDLRTGNFDATLKKYGPTHSTQVGINQANQALKELRQQQAGLDLKDLWAKYFDYKKPQLAPSTIKVDFERRIANALKALPTTRLNDAGEIRDWLVKYRTPDQAKRILTQFSACCDWAKDGGLIEINPFEAMARKIKSHSEEGDIDPFTESERDRLITVFRERESFYAPLIEFLFLTGCRPSEALALQWDDLDNGLLTFHRTWVEGTLGGRLKTQKKRAIALSQPVLFLLSQLDCDRPLIFPSKQEGKHLDWHDFTNRHWRPVLLDLPGIRYRNPYQCRHTFITLRLRAGDTVADIARYCGNSPVTIYRRYAGSDRAYVPD